MKIAGLNPLFQVGLDVAGRSCLIVGGGAEAENKAARLLDAGARLTVVSPTVVRNLQKWGAGAQAYPFSALLPAP